MELSGVNDNDQADMSGLTYKVSHNGAVIFDGVMEAGFKVDIMNPDFSKNLTFEMISEDGTVSWHLVLPLCEIQKCLTTPPFWWPFGLGLLPA